MLAVSVFSSLSSGDLLSYIERVRAFPILSETEERTLAENWYGRGVVSDAHKLVTSHLRLVVKVASGFRSYGLPLMDLIMEGNVGLMQAVKRFNPGLGFRLATYAVWWIKASIKDYILRSWSCVRVGTTQAQKKLFFSLRKIKKKLAFYGGSMGPEEVKAVASECSTSEQEVEQMDRFFLSRDVSLNCLIHEGGTAELQDMIPSQSLSQDAAYLMSEESALREVLIKDALSALNDRHREIFISRRLLEKPCTLDELSRRYCISRERVRQIELQALNKVRAFVEARRNEVGC